MKKVTSILGALLFSSICFAQQLKTYNGKYDLHSYEVEVLGIDPGLLNGTATYSYYENEDLQRIRSGKFNYAGKFSRNGVSLTVSISGNYSENHKDGKWSVNQSLKTPEVRQPGRVSTAAGSVNLNFTGSYKDGLPNGLWTSTLSGTQKGKTITGTHTLNFSKNVINGNFKNATNDGSGNTISGSLDSTGYFTGTTIVKKDGREYQLTFNNGLLVSSIGRSIQSGDIFENFKISEDELAIFNQLLNEKDSSIINEIPFKMVDGNNYGIDKLISNEFFDIMKNASLFNVTPGDFSIDENKRYNWIGFKIRVLEKSETRTEKLNRLKAEEEERQRLESLRLAKLKAEEEERQRLESLRLAKLKAEEEERQRLEAERILKDQIDEILQINKIKQKEIISYHFINYKLKNKPELYLNYFKLLTHYNKELEIYLQKERNMNKALIEVKKINNLSNKTINLQLYEKSKYKEIKSILKSDNSIQELERIFGL